MNSRTPHLMEAILTFTLLIVVMGIGIAVFGADPHIPMLIGTALAALMSMRLGYNWNEVEG